MGVGNEGNHTPQNNDDDDDEKTNPQNKNDNAAASSSSSTLISKDLLLSLLKNAGATTLNTTGKILAPSLAATRDHVLPEIISLLSQLYVDHAPDRVQSLLSIVYKALEHLASVLGASPRGVTFRKQLSRTGGTVVEVVSCYRGRQVFVEVVASFVKVVEALRTPECRALIEELSVLGCRILDVCGTDQAGQLMHDLGDTVWQGIELAGDPKTTEAIADVTAEFIHALEMEQNVHQPKKRHQMSMKVKAKRRKDKTRHLQYRRRVALDDDTVENVLESTLRSEMSGNASARSDNHSRNMTRVPSLPSIIDGAVYVDNDIPRNINIPSDHSSFSQQQSPPQQPPQQALNTTPADIEDILTPRITGSQKKKPIQSNPPPDQSSVNTPTRSVLEYEPDNNDTSPPLPPPPIISSSAQRSISPTRSISNCNSVLSPSIRTNDDDDPSALSLFYRTLQTKAGKAKVRKYRSFPNAAAASGQGYVTSIAAAKDAAHGKVCEQSADLNQSFTREKWAWIGLVVLALAVTLLFGIGLSFYGFYSLFLKGSPSTTATVSSPEVVVRVVREIVYALPDGTVVTSDDDGSSFVEVLKRHGVDIGNVVFAAGGQAVGAVPDETVVEL